MADRDVDDRLSLLERYRHWPHAPRDEGAGAVARFAWATLSGARWLDRRDGEALRSTVALQELPWDREQLRIRAARLTLIHPEGEPVLPSVVGAVEAAKLDGIGYLFTRIDASELGAIQACEAAGFTTVDAILSQYVDDVARASRTRAPGDVAVRLATADDAQLVADLVDATLHQSRFHADPLVGADRARAIYREWGANCVRGLNELTLIAEVAGRVAGFVSVKDNRAAREAFGWGYGRIELVAVVEEFRGRGVVAALTSRLFDESARLGWRRLGVGTQVSNVRAIRAYQKVGFAPGDTVFSMRWRVDDTSRTEATT